MTGELLELITAEAGKRAPRLAADRWLVVDGLPFQIALDPAAPILNVVSQRVRAEEEYGNALPARAH